MSHRNLVIDQPPISKWAEKMTKVLPGAPLRVVTTNFPAFNDILPHLPASFETLDSDILVRIFAFLDAPSTVRLALTGPFFLEKLVKYHDKKGIDGKDHDNKESCDPPKFWLRFQIPPMGNELVEIKGIMSTWMAKKLGHDKKKMAICCKFARFIVADEKRKKWHSMSPRAVVCGVCRDKFDDFGKFLRERRGPTQL
ncbi:hypothetical protein HYFRA_00004585 [Hymenoscyphus fraxineus]|uniref:F-box domain-containing protein n=1 Tax=Hymenoscyphus fraxineus TaxID=746836 RepID=A0A9N9KXM1_9HELO|nr:hypothetical protein HYFRA_00004585 [Hymenoscyphus fraxineus]